LARLPLERLEHEIEELGAHINAGKARWLELVAEFDRREAWGSWGCRSCSEWVAWRCALDPRSAREHVRVARRLPELPLIREAFANGELSFSKVRALTRIAEPDSERDLLELATHATAAQLERIVRAARRVTAAEADENHRESFVTWFWDEHGCLCLSGRLPAEDGALFLRALEASREALHDTRREEGGSAEPAPGTVTSRGSAEPPPAAAASEPEVAPPPPVPSTAEAFAAMAETALARPASATPGGERHQVLVHIDADTLPRDEPGATESECAIADGPGLAPETVRRLLCDGSLVSILEREGKPLSVGRRTRTVPPAIRRALLARDGRCQYPSCERSRFVDAHHIVHWAHGGETSLENLVLLCRHHHRKVHEGEVRVERGAEGTLTFRGPGDVPLVGRSRATSSAGQLAAANRRFGRSPGAGTILTGTGEGVDLSLAVDAALSAGRWLPCDDEADRRPQVCDGSGADRLEPAPP